MRQGLAPLGVSTYIRVEHLERCIESLKRNSLAPQTDIYIFSDAPRAGHEKAVTRLRRYLTTIDGFKSVNIVEREYNNRMFNNRGGIKQLLDEYGQVIFLEEDVVVAPQFLSYMNQALAKYKDDPRVFSVSGYCPPIDIPKDYDEMAFFLRRFNAWGFGIWKDRFEKIGYIDRQAYLKLIDSEADLNDFAKNGGEDMLGMLRLDSDGTIDAFDVKAMYTQFINDQYTLYPRYSLTQNRGMDGSGTHCSKHNKYDVTLWNGIEHYDLPEFHIVQKIVDSHNRFRKPSLRVRWSEKVKILLTRYLRNKKH